MNPPRNLSSHQRQTPQTPLFFQAIGARRNPIHDALTMDWKEWSDTVFPGLTADQVLAAILEVYGPNSPRNRQLLEQYEKDSIRHLSDPKMKDIEIYGVWI